MSDWEVKLALCMLAGTLKVTPRDLELLRRLQKEAPGVHAHVISWLLALEACVADEELAGLVWRLENWGHKSWWRAHYRKFESLPMWFRQAYGWAL